MFRVSFVENSFSSRTQSPKERQPVKHFSILACIQRTQSDHLIARIMRDMLEIQELEKKTIFFDNFLRQVDTLKALHLMNNNSNFRQMSTSTNHSKSKIQLEGSKITRDLDSFVTLLIFFGKNMVKKLLDKSFQCTLICEIIFRRYCRHARTKSGKKLSSGVGIRMP